MLIFFVGNTVLCGCLTKGKDEFMGRCMVEPEMKMNGQEPPSPRLLWYNLMYGDQEAGEILAAFELFLVS